MRGHLVLVGAGVLLARRLRREGCTLHQHPAVANNVLLADIGNHSVDIVGAAVAGQISPLHHDTGRIICRGNDRHPQHPLPKAIDTQNGTVGEAVLYKNTSAFAAHASAKRFA